MGWGCFAAAVFSFAAAVLWGGAVLQQRYSGVGLFFSSSIVGWGCFAAAVWGGAVLQQRYGVGCFAAAV